MSKDELFRIPRVGVEAPMDQDCEMIFVDGGLLNNEPFEVTQKILREHFAEGHKNEDPEDPAHFDNTIIMIDPFPSEPADYGLQFDREGVMDIAGKVLKTLRAEPLVKPDNLLKAYTKEDNERFTISPSCERRNKGGKMEPTAGSKAIACGALDGFGGFLSKSFREHDFFLGRKTARAFEEILQRAGRYSQQNLRGWLQTC
ncbi:MAG: hypothetical protein IPL65_03600 [Lewinellaceae bacterium]|nr:hypothetical protein [Lewinellaceae bacterium]